MGLYNCERFLPRTMETEKFHTEDTEGRRASHRGTEAQKKKINHEPHEQVSVIVALLQLYADLGLHNFLIRILLFLLICLADEYKIFLPIKQQTM